MSTAPLVEAPVAADNRAAAAETAPDNTALALFGGAGLLLVLGGGFYALRRRRSAVTDNAPMTAVRTSEPVAPIVPATGHMDRQAPPVHAYAAAPASSGAGDLDTLVAAQPSRENPFLTRKNRIRRANFLLRHGQTPHRAASDRAEPKTAAQTDVDRKPAITTAPRQMVYSFGPSSPARPVIRKPSTT